MMRRWWWLAGLAAVLAALAVVFGGWSAPALAAWAAVLGLALAGLAHAELDVVERRMDHSARRLRAVEDSLSSLADRAVLNEGGALVHLLSSGRALCGFHDDPPSRWPSPHTWTHSRDEVTCGLCLMHEASTSAVVDTLGPPRP